MAIHAIKWRINQFFEPSDRTKWDQVMDRFLKVCKSLHDFCAYFHEVYIHGVLWP